MTAADWGTVVSASAAVAAAAIAFWSFRISKQALTVSLRQEQRLQSPLDLYLADAYIRRSRQHRRRVYVFQLVITNRADLANSLRTVDLAIGCVRAGVAGPEMVVPHDATTAFATNLPQVLTVPSSLPARGVVAGAALFGVPDDVLAGTDVESYRLSVSDALGRVAEVEAIILREQEDGVLEENGCSDQKRS